MSTTTPNPHNLPPALARAQRPVVEPSLASLGIDAFEPAKPGLPGQTPAKVPLPAPPLPVAAAPSEDPALHVYIATFAIKKGPAHTNVKIEVPATGTPQLDVASAWAEIRRQFPAAPKNGIVRTSGKISPRAGTGAQSIPVTEGLTIRQLFPDRSEFETSRLVGRVSFEGEPHAVILRHLRSKSVFSITLKPNVGPATINFSEQVTTMRLAAELPGIINQLLGGSAKNLELFFVKS